MLRHAIAGAISFLILTGISSPAAAVKGNCWGKLKAPLERGGYSNNLKNPTDCSEYYSFDLKYVGQTNGIKKYKIYDMGYSCPRVYGGHGHGGGRVLIFDNHLNYLGQYVENDAFKGVWIKGSAVHFDYPKKWGNVLKLDGPEPPKKAWFLGDTVWFTK